MSKNGKAVTKLALTRRRNAAGRTARRRETAFGRLWADGAMKPEQIRKRLRWVAAEWGISPGDFPSIRATLSQELVDFVGKYQLNWDWLIRGDLNGLRLMTNARRARRFMTSTAMESDE